MIKRSTVCHGIGTSYIGMTRKKMTANRKGIGPTTLKHACNSTTNTCTKYLLVVMHKTLCSVWLTFVWRENKTVQTARLFSPEFFIILLLLLFLIRCNSQTTQARELTQTRLQIAPSILITFHIKKDTRHVRLKFQGTVTVSYSIRHRNSTNTSK